jgi:hypothetical protein
VTTVDSDASETAMVRDYLGRLYAAGWRLDPARRDELVAEVREHVEAALRAEGEAGHHGEAAVRNVLDRLGSPEEIARVAIEQDEPVAAISATPAPEGQAVSLRDISTILLLMFGGFLFAVGWFAGVLLLWTSPRWRTRDKWFGTLVWPFGYAGIFLVSAIGGLAATSESTCTPTSQAGEGAHQTCTSSGFSLPPWLGITVLVIMLLAPVAVGIHLLKARTERTTG